MEVNFHSEKKYIVVLSIILIVTVIYTYFLAFKRFDNYEYGKFDLGNMSQIVWNSANGRFMEVTDQFGNNMPRWGMSHVDPILLIFVPIYWIYANPMFLILAQHIVILSAIFPLFLLINLKTKNPVVGILVSLSYLFYPAIGFTLVWTGFHGISFVAPLLIWLIWILEKTEYFKNQKYKKSDIFVYWFLVILMLMGKEEIGAILSIFSIFLFIKNKKLAVWTFFISFIWFMTAFFIVIPNSSHYRKESINTFLQNTKFTEAEAGDADDSNFFFIRYSYLGNSYKDMLINLVTKPELAVEVIMDSSKLEAFNDLVGPLGYITLLSPFWIISLPDMAIVFLSKDDILDISNHRMAFFISGLFLSYVFFLTFINKLVSKTTTNRYGKPTIIFISLVVLGLNVYFSMKTLNPLFISGESFIDNKIISKIFAKNEENTSDKKVRSTDIPVNDKECLDHMVSIIYNLKPEIYSGPDYLGAHSSLVKVNALFPARYWDSDLVISDIFETKTVDPLGFSGWVFNKDNLKEMVKTKSHYYSCGRVSAFITGVNQDSSVYLSEFDKNADPIVIEIGQSNVKVSIHKFEIPHSISDQDNKPIIIYISKEEGEFEDKVAFWTLESTETEMKYSFLDYTSVGYVESLDNAEVGQIIKEQYNIKGIERFQKGEYKLYWGIGDTLDGREAYLGNIRIE